MVKDVVLRRMLEECFGTGCKVEGEAVVSYFKSVKEAIEGNSVVVVPELGAFFPEYLMAWKMWIDRRMGLRDVGVVARGAIEELKGYGYSEKVFNDLVDKFKLREYVE